MWARKDFSFQEIGIEGEYLLQNISKIHVNKISKFHEKEKEIFDSKGNLRATCIKGPLKHHGSYGNLYKGSRITESEVTDVLLKQPRLPEMNLIQEAILQELARQALVKEGITWCIPQVYDVFQKEHHVWFSMDEMKGLTVLEWFQMTHSPDHDFYLLVSQMSLILWALEKNLKLDHRDLKVDNLLIHPQPCTIVLRVSAEHTWTLHSPFQVVLLDFGFACLGTGNPLRTAIVNLGDGVLPPMDPCPKEGRDLFQLLISLIGLAPFREKISRAVQEKIDKWLSAGNKSYGHMARRWSAENWTYLVTSQPSFSIPSCCPEPILKASLDELSGFLQFK